VAGLCTGPARSGEIAIGEVRLQLHSAHAIAGSLPPTTSPMGHVFERDGRSVAAVELNGTEPVIFIAAGRSSQERQASVLASLALELLWDPKETGLAD
jgi:hypothetical protein